MVSEKTPRRSRTGKTGAPAATEDLEATAVEQSSEAFQELPDAIPAEKPVDAADVDLATNADADVSEIPAPISGEEKPEEPASAEWTAQEPAATEGDAPASEPPVASMPAPAPAKTGTSLSGALAAGILGGLVSLAGAGALQYAGYLPAPAPGAPAPVTAISVPSPSIAALETEVDALKTKLDTLAIAAPAVDTRAIEARLAALETAPAPAASEPAVDVAPLTEKLATVETELARIQGVFASNDEKQQSMQTNLLDRLQSVEAEVKDPKQKNAVARAIAASGLKAAIDRGGSFVSELETFAGVAADEPAVASLKAYAEQGVPTRADLAARFPAAANAVLAELNKPDPSQGITERLWSSALSLVKVRPVGQVEGDTPEAFIARCEIALQSGDLDKALVEWNHLPENGRAAAADFGTALAARIEVEKLVGATLKDAVIGAAGN